MSPIPRWMQPLEAPECPPGWRTGPPDFVGVGAQRCGTSWWYRGTIRSHPQVVRIAKPGKELHYFDRFWGGEPPRLRRALSRAVPTPGGCDDRGVDAPVHGRLLEHAAPS